MGLAQERNFAKYHQVLNRASWSTFAASRILLGSLLSAFDTGGALVFGLDETLERRWGKKIEAKGIYRDAVRSSHSHFVKCSGLRWISLMLLVPVPWAKRVWALPVLTALAPSERYCQERNIRHKKLTDWARQIVFLLRRWLPKRDLVVVADSGYSALDLLHACQHLSNPVTVITRLRLDAALYESAPPRRTGLMGRPRLKGKRLPTLAKQLDDPKTTWQSSNVIWYQGQERNVEVASGTAVWYHTGKPPVAIRWLLSRDPKGKFDPQALLCTTLTIDPSQIIAWFILRWCLEVTFQEVRLHLGVETQRQWSSLAIFRTTPILLGLFSIVALTAHNLYQQEGFLPRSAAWYFKILPTFSDALATLRERLWRTSGVFGSSSSDYESKQIPALLLDRLVDMLCYAT
jgi:DDE superfamily endonuclease